jgi:hypothetical protein
MLCLKLRGHNDWQNMLEFEKGHRDVSTVMSSTLYGGVVSKGKSRMKGKNHLMTESINYS